MRAARVILVLTVALAGCGGSEGIGEQASSVLMPQVEAVRAAATAGNRAGAVQGLGQLKVSVTTLNQQGDLGGEKLRQVNALIADVERFVSAIPEPDPAPAPLEFPSEAVEGSQSQSQPGQAERGKSGEKGEKGNQGNDGGDD